MSPSLFPELRSWSESRGAEFHEGFTIADGGPVEGRGMYCAGASMEEGAQVMIMPITCQLRSTQAQKETSSSLWKACGNDDEEDEGDGGVFEATVKPLRQEEVALALLLIREMHKGRGSDHREFIQSLPTLEEMNSFDFPLFWPDPVSDDSANVAKAFTGVYESDCDEGMLTYARAALTDQVLQLKETVKRQHDQLCERWDELPLLAYDEWAWACAILHSRSFENGCVSCLIPYLDMANHAGRNSKECNTVWRFKGTTLTLFTTRKVSVGEQLRFDYAFEMSGSDPVEQEPPFYFLLHYSFLER